MPKWIVGTSTAARMRAECGGDELLVVGRRERADPRVEQLHDVGARTRLRRDVRGEAVGELVHQRAPHAGLAVHERLHGRELARRLTLDEVAGDGEGAAAEADHRLLGLELAAHDADRLEHRRERLLRIGDLQALDVGERAYRLADHRADAFDEIDVDAHAEHRRHDVREHDGRVDAVPAHRLQRHLGTQLRRVRDVPEGVLLAHRAVLGQRAARLPHEPDGRVLDRLAAGGADEKRIHGRLP